MLRAALLDPIQDRLIVFQTMDGFFESVAIEFQKTEEMFIESDCFVIVTVEQTFAMEPGLVDQAREMNVAAELFVRSARMQSSHETKLSCVRGLSGAERHVRLGFLLGRFRFGQ